MKFSLKENLVTPEADYINRRQFIKSSVAAGAILAGTSVNTAIAQADDYGDDFKNKLLHTDYGKDLELNSFKEITNYNNFYEFGTDKRDPAKNAHTLKPNPWNITVTGACNKPGEYHLEDFIKPHKLEERIYRLRCVEGWSMVVPWVGIELASVIKSLEPTSNAKFVVFKTLLDTEQMPWQKRPILDWPYIEGLTIAEATNPLAMLAVGLYGKDLPKQNGAPIRLVVPWKYGFKNIKSITSIHFQNTQPVNTWQVQAPKEYGFYANVNPSVDHPRWSQKTERMIGKGSFLFPKKRDTELFNGYQQQVGHLYAGLDLTKNF